MMISGYLMTLLFANICGQTITTTTTYPSVESLMESGEENSLSNFKYDPLCSLLPQIAQNISVNLGSKYRCPPLGTLESSKVIDERRQLLRRQLLNYVRNSKHHHQPSMDSQANYNQYSGNSEVYSSKLLTNPASGQQYKVIPAFKKINNHPANHQQQHQQTLNTDESIRRTAYGSAPYLPNLASTLNNLASNSLSMALQNSGYGGYGSDRNSYGTSGMSNPSTWDMISGYDDGDTGMGSMYKPAPVQQPVQVPSFFPIPIPYPAPAYPQYGHNYSNDMSTTTTTTTTTAAPTTAAVFAVRPDSFTFRNLGLSQSNSPIPLNRLDFGTGTNSLVALNSLSNPGQPLFVVSKNLGISGWILLLVFILVAPLILGLAFIPLILKSVIFLLQIARNSGAIYPLISHLGAAGALNAAASNLAANFTSSHP